jgi:hypothetical protein
MVVQGRRFLSPPILRTHTKVSVTLYEYYASSWAFIWRSHSLQVAFGKWETRDTRRLLNRNSYWGNGKGIHCSIGYEKFSRLTYENQGNTKQRLNRLHSSTIHRYACSSDCPLHICSFLCQKRIIIPLLSKK